MTDANLKNEKIVWSVFNFIFTLALSAVLGYFSGNLLLGIIAGIIGGAGLFYNHIKKTDEHWSEYKKSYTIYTFPDLRIFFLFPFFITFLVYYLLAIIVSIIFGQTYLPIYNTIYYLFAVLFGFLFIHMIIAKFYYKE